MERQELQPDYVLNCHVDDGFCFTVQECQFMRANLADREHLYRELLPWDHPNYGLDEHWVRCHPYEQHVVPGARAELGVVFTNHSNEKREAVCQLILPEEWQVPSTTQAALIEPLSEGHLGFAFDVPCYALPGRWVVPVDVTFHGKCLGQFREAILVIGASTDE